MVVDHVWGRRHRRGHRRGRMLQGGLRGGGGGAQSDTSRWLGRTGDRIKIHKEVVGQVRGLLGPVSQFTVIVQSGFIG